MHYSWGGNDTPETSFGVLLISGMSARMQTQPSRSNKRRRGEGGDSNKAQRARRIFLDVVFCNASVPWLAGFSLIT